MSSSESTRRYIENEASLLIRQVGSRESPREVRGLLAQGELADVVPVFYRLIRVRKWDSVSYTT